MNKFDPKIYCDAAISFALQFGKQYSYQPKDIEEMDDLLEMIHEHYQNKEISEQTVGKIAASQGIYLGQVMLDTKLSECGFAWSMDENGNNIRKIIKGKLFEISAVVNPAYPDTTLARRNFTAFAGVQKKSNLEFCKARLRYLQLKSKSKIKK
jgi:hypothetical protein